MVETNIIEHTRSEPVCSAAQDADEEDKNKPIPYFFLWRILQLILLVIGVVLVAALLFLPNLGIALFWNLIIPVAPAIVVIIPGIWRNICPMASVSLLPRHLGFSKRQIISERTHGYFTLIGFCALLIIVCLRHLGLNISGPSTAFMLVGAAALAFLIGCKYEWKSAWCSGLCPIHPVEKLYGTAAAVTVPNAHCTNCEKCFTPCSDSTKAMTPLVTNNKKLENMLGLSMVGGFFGYIWGWYHVPDYTFPIQLSNVIYAFSLPLGGFMFSLGFFLLLYTKASKQRQAFLIRFFAMAAVSCYYWYRIPMLFGWGLFPKQSMLVDLTDIMPHWFPIVSQIMTTIFFIWFMILRKTDKRSWSIRPAYSTLALAK
ncbi:MAG: ferredoxin [Zetaproteobacteria bacterium]|nr:MAG: ferredoxin [Zetaproteobacteria bacterium]